MLYFLHTICQFDFVKGNATKSNARPKDVPKLRLTTVKPEVKSERPSVVEPEPVPNDGVFLQ